MASPEGRARGFTVVEVMVSLAVFAVIFYVIYDMFVGGIRAFRRQEGKTQSMEGAILAYERIATDLRDLLYYGWRHDQVDAVRPVGIGENGRLLRFVKMGGMHIPAEKDLPTVLPEEVIYRLVPSERPDFKYLSRNGTTLHGIRLVDMLFEPKQSLRSDGKPVYFLSVRIWGYGEQEQDHNLVLGLVGLDAYSQRNIHPYWVQNPKFLTGGLAGEPF